MSRAVSPIPPGYATLTPVLTFDDAALAISWYQAALEAEELSRHTAPNRKVLHAELRIGTSRIMVCDALEPNETPQELGGSPVSFWVYVDNADALFSQAIAAGAHAQAPMSDHFWGDRCGRILDPFGYSWSIASRTEELTPEQLKERQASWISSVISRATQL
jgi:PhnB protein